MDTKSSSDVAIKYGMVVLLIVLPLILMVLLTIQGVQATVFPPSSMIAVALIALNTITKITDWWSGEYKNAGLINWLSLFVYLASILLFAYTA